MKEYRSYIKRISPEIKPVKVALDASGGIAGEVMSFLCKGLPVDFVRSHCEPDRGASFLGKTFPTNEVKRSLQKSMEGSDVLLGVAVDFDADRCCFCDEKGNMIPDDVVGALIARTLVQGESDLPVAYDVRSTAALREEVKAADGEAFSCGGDNLSLAKALAENGAAYASDVYGHYLFKSVCCAPSPTLAMLYLCAVAQRSGKSLSQHVDEVKRYSGTGVLQYNMPSKAEAEKSIEKLKQEFANANKRNLYGVRFQFPDWWFHIRNPEQSSALQLVVEGKNQTDCRRGREAVEKIINRFKR